MEQITVRDMIKYMESGGAFSLIYITYDAKRNKGGKVISYPEAMLLQSTIQQGQRQATAQEAKQEELKRLRKDPNHGRWYTRNIRLLVNGYPSSVKKKIHPPLVVVFNDQIVVV